MPQWSRDRTADRAKYPDERARANAPRALVPLLRRYDHHVIRVLGRPALLLTYVWDIEPPGDGDSVPVEVSFTYAPGHPPAPPDVQAATDRLTFTPVRRAAGG